jgi:hypothetical protein
LTELDEVAVVFIIDFNNTPWIFTATNFTAVRCLDELIRSNNREGNLADNLFRFCDALLIFILVRRRLEDADVVMGNVSENLGKWSKLHM